MGEAGGGGCWCSEVHMLKSEYVKLLFNYFVLVIVYCLFRDFLNWKIHPIPSGILRLLKIISLSIVVY